MYIKIKLKPTKTYPKPITFPILLPALKKAMAECYLGIGTPYEPIAIDNFVKTGSYAFPVIKPSSDISISLESDTDDNKGLLKGAKLVCCMVKNVGKAFTDKNCELNGYWNKIFDYNKRWVQSSPDGTLYISPNKKKKCIVSTKDVELDDNLSYSIMFSMVMRDTTKKRRRYYFVLDPLVKISSGAGTGIPK